MLLTISRKLNFSHVAFHFVGDYIFIIVIYVSMWLLKEFYIRNYVMALFIGYMKSVVITFPVDVRGKND